MNSTLLLSNAIALAVLLGLHFVPESNTAMVAQRMPHYLQLQKAPQLAILNDPQGATGHDVSERTYQSPRTLSERLVF